MSERSLRLYETFVERAREVHGSTYEYGRLQDQDTKGRVKIICADHGGFWQTRGNHLAGRGCKSCALASKTTTVERFIEKAKVAHGDDRYDYELVTQFRTTQDKVEIICPFHGLFSQVARDHMRGVGCANCAIESNRKTFDEFLEQARTTHGDRYQYLRESWRAQDGFVTVVCGDHGKFKQRQWNHIAGDGCPDCGLARRTLGFSGFLERAKAIHGDRYSYLESSYIDSAGQITVICKDHGQFEKHISNLFVGQGCPRCFGGSSRAEKELGSFLKAELAATVEFGNRSEVSPLELDIYIPKLKIAIEFNGIYWHSKGDWAEDVLTGSARSKETRKSQRCFDRGIQLLHIWEDDWTADQSFWKDAILSMCMVEGDRKGIVSNLHRKATENLSEAQAVYSRNPRSSTPT
jgi:ribosomal protein L36